MEKKPLKGKIVSVLRWAGWVLLVQVILINISAAFYAQRLTRYYDKPPGETTFTDNDNIFTKSWKLFTGPRYGKPVITEVPSFAYDTVRLKTKSGRLIEAWYGRTDSAAKGTVILFHGITVTKSSLLDEVNEFRYMGYHVLMVDFRGHGNSEGFTTTIGYRESEEVKLAWEYISRKGEKHIFLYGSSMGSVAISKAVSENNWKPAGLILDMPFLNLQRYLKGRARTLGFPRQPFAFLTTFWIGVERGFNGFRHSTARYAAGVHCPVLLQWGTLDHFVLRGEIQQVYDALATADKRLVVYEGAQHESFLRQNPPVWRSEVDKFLSAH